MERSISLDEFWAYYIHNCGADDSANHFSNENKTNNIFLLNGINREALYACMMGINVSFEESMTTFLQGRQWHCTGPWQQLRMIERVKSFVLALASRPVGPVLPLIEHAIRVGVKK